MMRFKYVRELKRPVRGLYYELCRAPILLLETFLKNKIRYLYRGVIREGQDGPRPCRITFMGKKLKEKIEIYENIIYYIFYVL
jgi:hypothetical protein